MNVRRYLWLSACVLAWTLTGCLGGSGSSGFDITENVAIEDVLDTRECKEFEGLMICPADTAPTPDRSASATPSPTPTKTPGINATPSVTAPIHSPGPETMTPTREPSAEPTPPPAPPMMVDTNVPAKETVACVPTETGACSFDFLFFVDGFPPDAVFRTAVRDRDDAPWKILPATGVVDHEPNGSSYKSPIEVDPGAIAPGEAPNLQLAVLVFLTDPGPLPATVELLGDTHADFAYVLPSVPVSTVGVQ